MNNIWLSLGRCKVTGRCVNLVDTNFSTLLKSAVVFPAELPGFPVGRRRTTALHAVARPGFTSASAHATRRNRRATRSNDGQVDPMPPPVRNCRRDEPPPFRARHVGRDELAFSAHVERVGTGVPNAFVTYNTPRDTTPNCTFSRFRSARISSPGACHKSRREWGSRVRL